MTFHGGYSKTKSICLPAGVYSPFACGGGWPHECGWTIVGHDISGGASSTCAPASGSFSVQADDSGTDDCCCDDKLMEVLENQDTMLNDLGMTSSAAARADDKDTSTTESSSHVSVDAVALIVGTVVFAGVLTGTVAVAFFQRQRYVALDDALSGR